MLELLVLNPSSYRSHVHILMKSFWGENSVLRVRYSKIDSVFTCPTPAVVVALRFVIIIEEWC